MVAENFRRYWREHLFGHFLLPAGAMTAAILVHPVCAVLPAIQSYRQALGFAEKSDTVSLDMAYIVAGTATGIAIGCIILLVVL